MNLNTRTALKTFLHRQSYYATPTRECRASSIVQIQQIASVHQLLILWHIGSSPQPECVDFLLVEATTGCSLGSCSASEILLRKTHDDETTDVVTTCSAMYACSQHRVD